MSKLFQGRWRTLRVLLFLLVIFSLALSYIYLRSRPAYALYHALTQDEVLSSHELARLQNNKFVLFRQLQGAGFNNQIQEILLFHHLALASLRVYVYQPFVWRPRGEKAFVPLSAFVRGPIEGAISAAVFDQVCPPNEVTHVKLTEGVAFPHLWENAKAILSRRDRCIVVDDWIFNWRYLASPAIHDIWPSFRQYLHDKFAWSPQVLDIVKRAQDKLNLRSKPTNTDGDAYIALHFRRGDFEEHCHILAKDHTGFTTWATLPSLASSIFPPVLNTSDEVSILEHCYPNLTRIIDIIDTYARGRPYLRTLHVLHDGTWDHPLVYWQKQQLEGALKDATRAQVKGWSGGPMRRVTHSGMLPLQWGEGDWGVAVDVELARNAEAFIGNGFSSLSSQVIALRLADGGSTKDITFL